MAVQTPEPKCPIARQGQLDPCAHPDILAGMNTFRRLCVYCGSSNDVPAAYFEAANAVGTYLANNNIGVVYGGGNVGLMGEVANAALAAGGEVIGVIPEKLQALEVGHNGLSELYVVQGMHARKLMMAQLSDGFIALPGGWGTLEELCEVTTWTQLNYHKKPVGILNVNSYYDHFLSFLENVQNTGFIRPIHGNLVQVSTEIQDLVTQMRNAEIPDLKQWLDKP